MKILIKIIAKICFFPLWIIMSFIFFLFWVGLLNDYEAWIDFFIKRYFSL